jgi:hypothetical protein
LRCLDAFIGRRRWHIVGSDGFTQVRRQQIYTLTGAQFGVEGSRLLLGYERLIAAAVGQNAASQVDAVERLRPRHARASGYSGNEPRLGLNSGHLPLGVELGAALCCGDALYLTGLSQLTAVGDKPSLAVRGGAHTGGRYAYEEHQKQ